MRVPGPRRAEHGVTMQPAIPHQQHPGTNRAEQLPGGRGLAAAARAQHGVAQHVGPRLDQPDQPQLGERAHARAPTGGGPAEEARVVGRVGQVQGRPIDGHQA